jgi:hypothetical protein
MYNHQVLEDNMPKARTTVNIDRFLLLHPLLVRISDGKFFRTVFFWLFRALACFTVLTVLWASWKLWSNLPSGAPIKFFAAALLAEVFLLATGYAVFNILWIRAENIIKLPATRDYSVTPIMVISVKASGEIWAVASILFGCAFSLTSWIAGPRLMSALPISSFLPGVSGGGIVALISGVVLGFVVLATSYFSAELMGALVDIARNTKKGK